MAHPNPDAMGPVAYRGNQWVGYDDVDIVRKKGKYVADNGLGGECRGSNINQLSKVYTHRLIEAYS